ncbi:PA domain-containing protein [Flavobacterium cyclinae]|uniref:PA domain-containing protein n=1 Tax=Flavobacterium cyclinae TaxID=2895947 RepID=UPI002867EFEB|nr:PA domain-containing protein [Flavobacterium cyclinae]
MNKRLLFLFSAFFVYSLTFGQSTTEKNKEKTNVTTVNKTLTKKQAKAVRKKHAKNLAKSPFKETLSLSKTQRKSQALPPNKYFETEWELTMDPVTGAPTPEKLIQVKEQLRRERQEALAAGRVPGDASDNNWVERGPNNVGGRVRAIMFDPNDPTFKRVFAGGVSGGLWVNNDITTNTAWTRVNIDENLSVSAITYDPNNTNIFYLGTGESYVGGDVNGNGVWKSTDGGTSWTKVFGGITGSTSFQSAASLTINSPAGIAGEYTCYPTTAFGTLPAATITANIVLVSDNVAPSSDGCETLTNAAALNGKIALIRRGSCNFTVKVKSAQDAGAVGVIMMNNISGTPVAMGGDDATITIPSIMISQSDGDLLEAAVNSGTVSGSLNPIVRGAFTGNLVPGQQHINDIKVRNNGGVSEIYVAVGDTFYSAANQATYLGGPGYGLYKSTDGGVNWDLLTLPLTSGRNRFCPNDIEIGPDNKIWMATTNSTLYGDGGGVIFSSIDGVNFTQEYDLSNSRRTQIAISATNPNKIYVLAEDATNGEANIYLTTNSFSTVTTLPEPAAIHGTTATDFCRGQAFYDLTISVDPTNDAIVYIGGIDIHRSTNSGSSWQTISKWSSGYATGVSVVHADQHAMVFRPGNSNQAIFGHDGGVSYASSLSTAAFSTTAIATRVNGFNITQFYSVGVAPTQAVSGLSGEYFAAGAQDNGTQFFSNASSGLNSSVQSQGGDGAYTMFDQDADKYYISNYVYNESINLRPLPGSSVTAKVIDNDNNANNGAFIAPMVLDSNLDILYADYTTSTGVFLIRRYSNLKGPGVISRTNLTNALLTASPTAFAVSPYTTNSTTLLVGTRLGKLLRITSANATPTWTDITGPSFVGSISDVEFGASNNEIFVTMHNYNVVSIWYTQDGGATWSNKEGNFPDIPVKAILPNPLKNVGGFATEVIIGTELGVWYCNNFNSATPNWIQSYNGMSNVKVTDLDMRNDYTVYAATYGRGVFSGMFTNTTLSGVDFVNSSNIKIYPSPAKEIINVAISNYSGDLNIEMYDINGRIVKSVAVDFTESYAVDLNGLSSGVYVVKIAGDQLNYTEKIIIN